MKASKKQFEEALTDVVCELELCSPELLAAIIEDMKANSEDDAILSLAEFIAMAHKLLEVSQSMGEA